MKQEAAFDWQLLAEQWCEDHPHRLWRQHSDYVNCALLQRWLPNRPIESVLKTDLFDEAFGSGLCGVLEERASKVYGIELSQTVISRAEAQYPKLRGVATDIRRLPFGAERFDVVVSNSTLDHFPKFSDLVTSLRELVRVLRPGGNLLLTLDNPVNPVVALRNRLPSRWLSRTGLVPYFIGATCGPQRLRAILKDVGLQPIQCTAVLHCPRVLVIPLASLIDRTSFAAPRGLYLKFLRAFESLGRPPSRYITGHFVAVLARKQRV